MLIAYIKHLTFCTDIVAVDWRHVIDMPFGSHKPSGSKDTQTACWFPASMYFMGKLCSFGQCVDLAESSVILVGAGTHQQSSLNIRCHQ